MSLEVLEVFTFMFMFIFIFKLKVRGFKAPFTPVVVTKMRCLAKQKSV